jgi:hypothetical protein
MSAISTLTIQQSNIWAFKKPLSSVSGAKFTVCCMLRQGIRPTLTVANKLAVASMYTAATPRMLLELETLSKLAQAQIDRFAQSLFGVSEPQEPLVTIRRADLPTMVSRTSFRLNEDSQSESNFGRNSDRIPFASTPSPDALAVSVSTTVDFPFVRFAILAVEPQLSPTVMLWDDHACSDHDVLEIDSSINVIADVDTATNRFVSQVTALASASFQQMHSSQRFTFLSMPTTKVNARAGFQDPSNRWISVDISVREQHRFRLCPDAIRRLQWLSMQFNKKPGTDSTRPTHSHFSHLTRVCDEILDPLSPFELFCENNTLAEIKIVPWPYHSTSPCCSLAPNSLAPVKWPSVRNAHTGSKRTVRISAMINGVELVSVPFELPRPSRAGEFRGTTEPLRLPLFVGARGEEVGVCLWRIAVTDSYTKIVLDPAWQIRNNTDVPIMVRVQGSGQTVTLKTSDSCAWMMLPTIPLQFATAVAYTAPQWLNPVPEKPSTATATLPPSSSFYLPQSSCGRAQAMTVVCASISSTVGAGRIQLYPAHVIVNHVTVPIIFACALGNGTWQRGVVRGSCWSILESTDFGSVMELLVGCIRTPKLIARIRMADTTLDGVMFGLTELSRIADAMAISLSDLHGTWMALHVIPLPPRPPIAARLSIDGVLVIIVNTTSHTIALPLLSGSGHTGSNSPASSTASSPASSLSTPQSVSKTTVLLPASQPHAVYFQSLQGPDWRLLIDMTQHQMEQTASHMRIMCEVVGTGPRQIVVDANALRVETFNRNTVVVVLRERSDQLPNVPLLSRPTLRTMGVSRLSLSSDTSPITPIAQQNQLSSPDNDFFVKFRQLRVKLTCTLSMDSPLVIAIHGTPRSPPFALAQFKMPKFTAIADSPNNRLVVECSPFHFTLSPTDTPSKTCFQINVTNTQSSLLGTHRIA